MDKRLEGACRSVSSPGELYHLCTSAVIYARQDFNDPTPDDPLQDELNFQLANVLRWGYSIEAQNLVTNWDTHQTQLRLLSHHQQPDLVKVARQIGNQALFVASQEIHPSAHTPTFCQSTEAIGQLSYLIVAANTPDKKIDRIVYNVLGNQFPWFSHLLGHAGILLGMGCLPPRLINPLYPVVTTNDFLEILSEFGRYPDHQHWEKLRQAAIDRKWSNPEFKFELPAEPSG